MDVPEYEAVERCWAIISNSPYKPHKGPWTFEQVEKLVKGAYEWVAEDNEAKDEIVDNLRKKGLVK